MASARPPRRLDARASAESSQLEPRILTEHPLVPRADASAEHGLRARVLEERGSVLGRVVAGFEQVDPPALEHAGELGALVLVLRAEPRATGGPLDARDLVELAQPEHDLGGVLLLRKLDDAGEATPVPLGARSRTT